MKKILTLSLLLMVLEFTSFAQPGYQGKRLSIFYSPNITPSWTNLNLNGQEKLSSFNVKHNLETNYVWTNKKEISLNLYSDKTGVHFSDYIGNVTSNGIDLKLRFYSYHSLAPLGTYYEIGIGTFNSKINVINENGLNDRYDGFYNDEGDFINYKLDILDSYRYYKISYSHGAHRVVFDKLIIKAAFEVGYVIGNNDGTFIEPPFQYDYTIDYDEPTYDPEERLWMKEIFSIKLGLGYLIY